ncbi:MULTISPECIES: hypothetical protein [unclassified Bradyrhizobium]|uniref:hypothetical protein n=1 Tax=unclassified Bradyrhizobium TaxID=2631580 RepID=UPI0028E9A272|nr:MULTISPECIES: hypothetical protein [unclassified Bradyrhizobium]
MSQTTADLPDISYPVLCWREGYIYLAATPLELCAHPRSMFEETAQRARAGEWHLVDADGRSFDVLDFIRVRPFGGIRAIGPWLLRSIFAIPVLANEARLPLSEFKKTLIGAIRIRYQYDSDKAPAARAIRLLQSADSYAAAIDALPKR